LFSGKASLSSVKSLMLLPDSSAPNADFPAVDQSRR
jgi:hypothetical protein